MFGAQVTIVYNNLPKITPALRREVSKVIKNSVEEGIQLAKDNAPVDTGALRDEIHAEDVSDLAGSVVSAIEYAIFNELGTVKMAPSPYMTPMAEVMRPRFFSDMADAAKVAARG